MNALRYSLCLALALLVSGAARSAASAPPDGARDFDFETGTWNIQVKRLLHPLTHSTTWVQPTGYVHVVRKLWDGRASLAELAIEGSPPHFAGSMLRLYDPKSRQWAIYWADSRDGALDPPLIGSFANGRGVFVNQETINGSPVSVRVVYSDITPGSFRTEQSFSTDGGTTWEPNLVQTFTRRVPLPDAVAVDPNSADHQHDFDFEFGTWKAHLHRLLKPLSGSNTWTDYDGTSILYPVWNGRANIGELELANATASIEGMTYRLYDPQKRRWSIYFANSRFGRLGTPMIGRFTNGRGEFYGQDQFDGKPIVVRFIFDEMASRSFRLVQSFSADGGRTWEPNWIATFEKVLS